MIQTEFTNTAKLGEAKSDAHKVSLENKSKFTMFDAEAEWKIKNNGEVTMDMKYPMKVSCKL